MVSAVLGRRVARVGARARRRAQDQLRTQSTRRLFAIYAAVSLVPILLIGVILVGLQHAQGDDEALAAGRQKAELLARASVAPLLGNRPIDLTLPADRRAALLRMISGAVHDGAVLRIRLRDLSGRVLLFGDAPSGRPEPAVGAAHPTSVETDDEAKEALRGAAVAHLTRLDADDGGDPGPRVIEVYEPLIGEQGGRLGVLEVYLPYAPISAGIAMRQRTVTMALAAGLLLLWLSLSVVSLTLARRLRRQAAVNSFLTTNDTLTGLPNRTRFRQRVARAVATAADGTTVAVAVFDLDHFEEVNDTLGHGTGDELLLQLAGRLEQQARPGDTVARLNGDEFGIVLRGAGSPRAVFDTLAALRAVIAEPAEINGLALSVEASVGVVLAPADGSDADLLLQRADLAMHVAKRQRAGIVRYRPDLEQRTATAATLVAELGTALAREELVLHFQPKGDLRAGRVTGLEALVRWQHPSRGLLPPDSFLPAAEQTDVIDDLTWWVVRTAVATLREIDPLGALSLSVNVSARSLIRPDFAGELLAVLAAGGADPDRLIVEITETALLADPDRAAAALERLHAAGLRVSIDDFGAGQTSLSHLVKLPIDELKIDKAFVLGMGDDPRNAAIVRSVVELGHSLGFSVTAEGVETLEALKRLAGYGCDTVQGFLLARPVTGADVLAATAEATAVLDAAAVLDAGPSALAALPAVG